MSISTLHIALTDVAFIIHLSCEILRVVLSVGGFMLAYHNMHLSTNNKANYMAISSIILSVLLIVGMKWYGMTANTMTDIEFDFYRIVVEWVQISMLIIVIRYINEQSKMRFWIIKEIVCGVAVGIGIVRRFLNVKAIYYEYNIGLILKITTLVGIIILFFISYKTIQQMELLYRKIFLRLFVIKIGVVILEVVNIYIPGLELLMVQCVLQVVFMLWVVAYIEEVTTESTWVQIEQGVIKRRKELQKRQKEQKIFVFAAREIKRLIEQGVGKVDCLENQITNEYSNKNKKYLDKMRNNARRLLALSQSILEVNQYEVGKKGVVFQRIDINELISRILESLEIYVKQHDLELEYEVPHEPIWAEVDSSAIERIVLNLVSNAVKYNRKNGKIKVSLEEKDSQVNLCVQDSGIGIPSKYLEKVFEKFERGEAKRIQGKEGSGLGLSIVKNLINQHDGEIKVFSGVGQGTKINISLPIVQERK